MFNLFGSLFFGSKTVETTSIETQTQHDSNACPPLDRSHQIKTSIEQNPHNESNSNDDWDIVDRSEEADKCNELDSKEIGVNTSIYQSPEPNETEKKAEEKSIFDRPEDDNDIILGSFFEKNANSNDDEKRYKTQGIADEDEEISEEVVAEIEKKEAKIFKSQSEKRKGQEIATVQADSQNGTLKRKGKKSKKSNNAVCNKENVRALLFNDARKSSSNGNKSDNALLNGKQMKRNNKSSAFKSNNVNMNKRKYHKLQQPVFYNNNL